MKTFYIYIWAFPLDKRLKESFRDHMQQCPLTGRASGNGLTASFLLLFKSDTDQPPFSLSLISLTVFYTCQLRASPGVTHSTGNFKRRQHSFLYKPSVDDRLLIFLAGSVEAGSAILLTSATGINSEYLLRIDYIFLLRSVTSWHDLVPLISLM